MANIHFLDIETWSDDRVEEEYGVLALDYDTVMNGFSSFPPKIQQDIVQKYHEVNSERERRRALKGNK